MEITNKDNVKKIVTIALASAGGLFLLKKLLFPTKSSLNVKKFEVWSLKRFNSLLDILFIIL